MEFQISAKAKKTIFGVIGVGLLALIVGIVQNSGTEQFATRLLSNFLIDGFFFFAIALGALFFLALQYATETGWSVAVKRVVEGVASYVVVGIVVLDNNINGSLNGLVRKPQNPPPSVRHIPFHIA